MSEIDVSQIKVSGPGLTGSKTGEKCILRLSGAPTNEIADGLSYSVDGPSKPDAMCSCEKDDEGNTFVECSFVALQAGEYKFTIRYRGRHIPGSPFKIKITGDTIPAAKLISKVTVHGRAAELGKAYAMNEFTVDCRSVQPVIGPIKVHVKGPQRASAQLNIKDNKNGTFKIMYKPTSPGNYTINIKIADTDIPGSPFSIRVTEFLSS